MATESTCIICHKPLPPKARLYCSEFCAKAKPCRICGNLKTGTSPYCPACRRDRTPSVELALDPEWRHRQETRGLRPKRKPTNGPIDLWWCSGCRDWLSPRWFLTHRQLAEERPVPNYCRPCRSARSHATRLKSEFGMDPDVYDSLLAMQGGRCAICHGEPRTARLAVDHDHVSGEIRGLLCSRCNTELLGAAHDSLEILRRAIEYLENPPAARQPMAISSGVFSG